MIELQTTTIVEKNELEEITQKDFNVANFHVGHDFLVLKKNIEDEHQLELSLWAYGKGMDEKTLASELEILIGIRDENGDIDILEDEEFDASEYSMSDVKVLLKELEEKMLSAI